MNARSQLGLLIGALVFVWAPAHEAGASLRSERVQEIEAALSDEPKGWGAPASDRASWERASESIPVRDLLLAAEEEMRREPPVLSDELYLRYSRDGDREAFQRENRRRLRRLNLLAWAEAVERRGRFLEPLKTEIEALLSARTWVLPAHDPELNNFAGRRVEIDLMAAMKGWSLATVVGWHGETLGPELMARIRAELQRRILAPYLARLARGPSAERDGFWWIETQNNWNAVCHAGVVGTALAVLDAKEERARIVAFAERQLEHYLRGFTDDGYCSEGVGYWNYGFGHFAMLTETLRQATSGVVAPLAGEHAQRIAAYPWRVQILPGVFPAFADMRIDERPSAWVGALATRQLHAGELGLARANLSVEDLVGPMLYESAMKIFLPAVTDHLPPATAPSSTQATEWFGDAQVYTGRATASFGAAIKGGHNAEHHNHNDVGSFVIAAGGRAVLVGPGLEIYTRRTFGPDRYLSQVLNSFGHSVPRAAGELQGTGRRFAAQVVTATFSENEGVIVLDLTGAYAVPALRSLRRTFTLRRGEQPEIVIVDTAEFSKPSSFESALVSFDEFHEREPGVIICGDGEVSLRIEVSASAPWTWQTEMIQEALPHGRKPRRLALTLSADVREATIGVTVRLDGQGKGGHARRFDFPGDDRGKAARAK